VIRATRGGARRNRAPHGERRRRWRAARTAISTPVPRRADRATSVPGGGGGQDDARRSFAASASGCGRAAGGPRRQGEARTLAAPLAAAIQRGDYAESAQLSLAIRGGLRRARTELDRIDPHRTADARRIVEIAETEAAPLLAAAPVLEAPGAGTADAEHAWRRARGRGAPIDTVPTALPRPSAVELEAAVITAAKRGLAAGGVWELAQLHAPATAEPEPPYQCPGGSAVPPKHATAMAARLGLGSVEIRADEDARRITDGEAARGVALAGVVHLHPEHARPDSERGLEVLAHELVHLAQARLPAEADAGRDLAETEAAELAPILARGGSPKVTRHIDLSTPAADRHGEKPRPTVALDVIAQATRQVEAAEALGNEIDAALADDARAGEVDAMVDRLAAALYMAKSLALSDPTLPEARKRHLPALLARIDDLAAEVIRYQRDHHGGESMLADAEGRADPAAEPVTATPDVMTVLGMNAALAEAIDAALADNGTRARGLHALVEDRFVALRYADGAEAKLRALGSARTFYEQVLDEANTALIQIRKELAGRRSDRLMSLALARFQAAAEILGVLSGELDPAASRQIGQVTAAAENALTVVLLPAVVAYGIVLAPEVALWATTNPHLALYALETAIAIAPQVLDEGLLDYLKGVKDDPARLADIVAILAHAHAEYTGNRASLPDVDGDAPAPRAKGPLPPEIEDTANKPRATRRERAARRAGDLVDDVAAAAEGATAWATARPIEDPLEAARTAGPDMALEPGTFTEHRSAARAKRLRSRAEAAEDAGHYEGRGAEVAGITRELRERGGRVAYHIEDPSSGDVWTAVDLPNGRRVTLRGVDSAGPRVREPVDADAAARRRHEATAAEARIAERNSAATAAIAALPRDGEGRILHLFDHITIGEGTSATINHATGGSTRGIATAERADAKADPLRIVNISAGAEPWHTRKIDMGQPREDFQHEAWAAQHGELATKPERYGHSDAHAAVLALTADREGVATVRGLRTHIRTGDFGEVVPGARAEITVVDPSGATVRYYARKVDDTSGPGPSRHLEPYQLGAAYTLDGGRKVYAAPELEGARERERVLAESGRLLHTDEALARPPAGRVLVSGGSASAPWIAMKVVKQGGTATWVARERGPKDAPVNPGAAAELAELRRELARTDLAPERRTYLEARARDVGAFGDADFPRNHDAFAESAIERRVGEIVALTPSESGGKVIVELSDGSREIYDAVVVAHGADPKAAGGPVESARDLGKLVPKTVDGDVVALETQDGVVRYLGPPVWSPGWTDRIGPTAKELSTWNDARRTQAQSLPPYSRGVNDSIAMAVRTISKANVSSEGDE
jgi:hypothetical protein